MIDREPIPMPTTAQRDRAVRVAALHKLKREMQARETILLDALYADLHKSHAEGYMCELGLNLDELGYLARKLPQWAKPQRHPTPLAQFCSSSYQLAEPYGVVLVMSPWNYPYLLSLDPLFGAIAAGNCVVLKPSAYAPNTSRAMAELIAAVFPPDWVTVIQGGREQNAALLEQKFDYIFFTGSVDVAGLGLILLKQVLFFVAAAVVVVWVAPALMTLAGVLKAPSSIAVMAVIICLAMAWASNLAGLSYAVGAFFAGIAVSNSDYAEDADRYIEPVGDTLFVPVFFVGIGLQTTGVDDTKMIVFIAIMTVLGVITKVVGCGLGGRMAGFGGASALMIGAGMVPRGEMALITAQIGFNEHVLGSEYYSTIIFIISLVTLVAPLLLKLTIRKVPGVGAGAAGTAGAEQ